MALQVVGAGLGRTGTTSLKAALEQLLGGPVHHMFEVFGGGPPQLEAWRAAADGASYEQWAGALDGFVASVDWPSCRWYEQLAAENPDAPVILSKRSDAETWWRSADQTIFVHMRSAPEDDPFMTMVRSVVLPHIGSYDDPEVAMAGYERHNAEVRERIPADRLLEWEASDGWEPICAKLGLPVPDEEFPRANTTADYRAMFGWG